MEAVTITQKLLQSRKLGSSILIIISKHWDRPFIAVSYVAM